MSAAVQAHFLTGLLGLVALGLLLRWLARRPAYRYALSRALLWVPVLSPLLRGVYLGRLCGSLGLLTGAHMPLLQAQADS